MEAPPVNSNAENRLLALERTVAGILGQLGDIQRQIDIQKQNDTLRQMDILQQIDTLRARIIAPGEPGGHKSDEEAEERSE